MTRNKYGRTKFGLRQVGQIRRIRQQGLSHGNKLRWQVTNDDNAQRIGTESILKGIEGYGAYEAMRWLCLQSMLAIYLIADREGLLSRVMRFAHQIRSD